MTSSRWHVYIGQLQLPLLCPTADLHDSDGQKRSVYIYRFLTAGTIDGEIYRLMETILVAEVPNAEKIYQRQITKLGLSSSTLIFLSRLDEVDLLHRSIDWRCENPGNISSYRST